MNSVPKVEKSPDFNCFSIYPIFHLIEAGNSVSARDYKTHFQNKFLVGNFFSELISLLSYWSVVLALQGFRFETALGFFLLISMENI